MQAVKDDWKARPCNDYGRGGCTAKGQAEDGFCKCKAAYDTTQAMLEALRTSADLIEGHEQWGAERILIANQLRAAIALAEGKP